MLACLEALDALIEHLCLLGSHRFLECAIVCHKRIGEVMLALVLAILIIIIIGAWSVNQSKAHGVVVRFVPTVFAVVEHSQAIRAISCRDVGPLLRYHFVGSIGVVAALHRTYTEVVGCLWIGKRHREFSL